MAAAKKPASKQPAPSPRKNSSVTSNKPSVYTPGFAVPGVDTGGNSNKRRTGGVKTQAGAVKKDKYGDMYYAKTTPNKPKAAPKKKK
jgi:hypothetical protein